MKITKEQLLYMFAELGAIYEGTPTGTLYGHALYDALKNDNLEIDGFERVEWTKFDPNDPNTFPQENMRWLIFTKTGSSYDMLFTGDETMKSFWAEYVTHWRPLPEPPVETEAGK